jgi:FkbM family methyltransferase
MTRLQAAAQRLLPAVFEFGKVPRRFDLAAHQQKLSLLRHMIEERGVAWAGLFVLGSVAKKGMRYLEMKHGPATLRDGKARVLKYVLAAQNAEMVRNLYSDIFVCQLYHFEPKRSNPLILDCGSNVGMSILYFKNILPQARIIGFEPDPQLFACLEQTVSENRLPGVRLVNAALADREGILPFYSDGKVRGCLATHFSGPTLDGWSQHGVPSVRLRQYVTEPVDLLKMDVEGAEWDILADTEDRLHLVHEIIVEFHHVPADPSRLNRILALLGRQGFACYVDGYLKPPIRLASEPSWTQHIYAQRISPR